MTKIYRQTKEVFFEVGIFDIGILNYILLSGNSKLDNEITVTYVKKGVDIVILKDSFFGKDLFYSPDKGISFDAGDQLHIISDKVADILINIKSD